MQAGGSWILDGACGLDEAAGAEAEVLDVTDTLAAGAGASRAGCAGGDAPACATTSYVVAVHDRLPPASELEFVSALRRFTELHDKALPSIAIDVGGDLFSHIDHTLSKLWKERYGITIEFERVIAATSDEQLKTFLGITVGANLVNPEALARLDSGVPELPCLHNVTAKLPAERGRPAKKTIEQVMACCKQRVPEEIILACPMYMTENERGSSLTGVDALLKQFQDMSYWATAYTFEEAVGQCATSERTYVIALSNVVGSHSAMSEYFASFLGALKCKFSPVWCMVDTADRGDAADAWSIALLSVVGPRTVRGADESHKLEHYNLFRGQNLTWPLGRSDLGAICNAGMVEREQDVAFFAHRVFPRPDDLATVEFLDIGKPLARICKAVIDQHNDGVCGSPWLSDPPIFTSSTRLLMRYVARDTHAIVVRLAEPFELMLFAGFSSTMFDTKRVAEVCGAADSDMPLHNLFWKLAVSSGTVSHYVALRLALLSTAGRFHSGDAADVTPAQQPDAMPASQAVTEQTFSLESTVGSDSAD